MYPTLIHMRIDGKPVECESTMTILDAAHQVGLYLPALCTDPGLSRSQRDEAISAALRLGDGDGEGCGLCMVELLGRPAPVRACKTIIEEGMVVVSDSADLKESRRRKLAAILGEHERACGAGDRPRRCLLCEIGLHITEVDLDAARRG